MLEDKIFLYVEDDASSRTIMNLMLSRLVKVKKLIIFEDSTDFTSRLSALPIQPDIILLDIHMEPTNGFEMIHLIRQMPEYQDKPVIALTASVMSEEVEQLRAAGFNGTISKPLPMSEFPALLQRIARGESVWYTS